MIKVFLILLVSLCVHLPFLYPESTRSLIYNKQFLAKKLKGKSLSEVKKVLGNPTIKKSCERCRFKGGYWWYNFPEVSIFIHYKNSKVFTIRLLTETERSKQL